MAVSMNEQISALVDGELSAKQIGDVLDALERERDKQCSWCHYHLISDALRNNLPDIPSDQLLSRVSLALADEAPHAPPPSAIGRQASPFPSFLRPAMGFAVAASVAAAVYVGVGWDDAPVGSTVPPVTVATATSSAKAPLPPSVPLPVQARPVESLVLDMEQAPPALGKQWNVDKPAVASKLNDYLANHDVFSPVSGVRPDVLPYIRIVGYGSRDDHQAGR
ncbi:MAG TPA: hypothetical protein ENJ19_05510 [Gammaproteobacteria bacterium]|nr:hypothetical protein [Gammaproteobacteria bacterium]